jgi:hypothetical protein
MKPSKFKSEMDVIKRNFENGNYTKDRIQLIWEAVRDMSDDWMERTVRHFVGNSLRPPVVSDFEERIEREYELRPKRMEKNWERIMNEPDPRIDEEQCRYRDQILGEFFKKWEIQSQRLGRENLDEE